MMLQDKLASKRIILASQSPRRKDLLSGLDINFEVIVIPDLPETYPSNLQAGKISEYLSMQKADYYVNSIKPDDNTIIITADTIVWLNNKVLNKPLNRNEAIQMLKDLSGNTHIVYTGVTIADKNKRKSFVSESFVEFRVLSEEEIIYYVDKYQPYDKAGAYGVQEWIGFVAIKNLNGSYFNVMGLPIMQLYQNLLNF